MYTLRQQKSLNNASFGVVFNSSSENTLTIVTNAPHNATNFQFHRLHLPYNKHAVYHQISHETCSLLMCALTTKSYSSSENTLTKVRNAPYNISTMPSTPSFTDA